MPAVQSLYTAYKDKVQFLLVYIREAHPTRKSTRPGARRRSGPDIAQHENIDERVIAATKCVADLKLSLPVLIDDMEGAFQRRYGGFPAGTVIVDTAGKIVYTARGPSGCRPKEARKHFKVLLGE